MNYVSQLILYQGKYTAGEQEKTELKEAEIVSSTEHLFKETFYSLVNQTKDTVCAQVAIESTAG